MVSLNNPAGRLYSLLGQLRKHENMPISRAWGHVLGVPEGMVREHLGDVAQLVSLIDEAVAAPERERIAAPVKRYRSQWIEAAFPLQHNFTEDVQNIRPTDEAFESLGFVADHLAVVASDGEIPAEGTRIELVDSLRAVITDVGSDEALPEDVAHLMIQRLSAVEAAILHIEVGGPNAVRLATEALIGSSVTNSSRAATLSKRALAIAGVVWVAFSSGPTVQQSINAWTELIPQLGTGSPPATPATDQAEPRPPDHAASR